MEKISDEIKCCICVEMYTDPRILPCIHTFCLHCIETTRQKSGKKPGDRMACPICWQQFTIPSDGLVGLRKNFFMERLMEIAKISTPLLTTMSCDICLINKDDADTQIPDASNYCVECRENMCEFCTVQHKRQKLLRDHQIVPFGSQLKDELAKLSIATYCNQHIKEELKMYCTDCKKVICIMCFAENHQLHKCSDVNKVTETFRDEIDVFIAKVDEGLEEGLERKLKIEQRKSKFIEDSTIAEAAIKDRVKELKELLDKHGKFLLDELIQRKAILMIESDNANEEIDRYLAIVDSFKSYCSEIKSKGTPADICHSVHDLRARADELRKISAMPSKNYSSAIEISFRSSSVEDDLPMENIVGTLEGLHACKSLTTITTTKEKELPKVSAEFVRRLGSVAHVQAVTKVDDKIYVLVRKDPRSPSDCVTYMCIFQDHKPFQRSQDIELRDILRVKDVASSDKLKCFYVFDSSARCIWKLSVDDCRVTPLLPIRAIPWTWVDSFVTLSTSNEGHLMLLRCTFSDGDWASQLEIYGSDANVTQSISLSHDVARPLYAVQESSGLFIVIHKYKLDHSSSRSWVISELNNDGQILRQFQPRLEYQQHMYPYHMSLDSSNNRLFVAAIDNSKFSVVIFDVASFDWQQTLLPSNVRLLPMSYDERKKQLIVARSNEVVVFKIRYID